MYLEQRPFPTLWGQVPKERLLQAIGSILVVDRAVRDLGVERVRTVCKFMDTQIMPYIPNKTQVPEVVLRRQLLRQLRWLNVQGFVDDEDFTDDDDDELTDDDDELTDDDDLLED